VFNNLISKDDWLLLVEKLRQGHGPSLLRRLASMSAGGRVQVAWDITESPPKYWGSLGIIHERWNLLATGDPTERFYEYVGRTYLNDREDRVAVSLACGTGAHEIRWAQTGRFARILGYDVSKSRIESARRRASEEGVEAIAQFEVGDVRTLATEADTYDVVIAINALHHISPLAPTIEWIQRVVKPGGLIIVRDYVGPDRFQWTARQLQIADELLHSIPVRFRTHWGSGTVKKRNLRPGRLVMRLSDPSEAAESSRIVPLLDEHFECLEKKDLGGAVLHILLKDIAHHFSADSKAQKHLERLMATEDELMAKGEVGSDFVFGVWQSNSKSKMQKAN